MKSTIKISPKVLEWVKTHGELTEKTEEQLKAWYSGAKEPTFKQLEDFSKKTKIPFGYFFLKEPPVENLKLIEYRTVDSIELEQPSRNLIDIVHEMECVQEWVHEENLRNRDERLRFVGAVEAEDDVFVIARFVRTTLDLKEDWFQSSKDASDSFDILRERMSEIGVTIMLNGVVRNNTRRSLDVKEFRAFALVDKYAPLIFINNNDSPNGRLFSLIHEFVHICLGENSLYNDQNGDNIIVSKTEKICNAVTAEILVPVAIFVKAWATEIAGNEAAEVVFSLAKKFRCGGMVIARRAFENGFINKAKYRAINDEIIVAYNKNQHNKKAGGGGNFYITQRKRLGISFLRKLQDSLENGTTQYTEAYRLTNTNRSTFDKLLSTIGGGDNEW